MSAVTLDMLETPAAVVDLGRMERNLQRAADYTKQHDLALRPHVKTHKSPLIAGEQLRLGAVGLTCATPHEAEVMTGVGDDLLIAYPPVGSARAARIARLAEKARVTVALDSERAIADIAAAAREAGAVVGVYVELDLGMHRVGIPEVTGAVALARKVIAEPSLEYRGIAFYPGHVREPVTDQDAALRALGDSLGSALEELGRADVAPQVVSGGSTPTLWRSHEIPGVTEIRPGTYVFNDRTTAAVGACERDDCALTVLATVVSTAVPGQAVIDAGTKSLGREPMRGVEGEGFGALRDRPEVIVARMSEEHGILDLARTDWRPRVGDRVRVVPNHVCIVVHLNDVVYGVHGATVERSWRVEARGRGQREIASA
jgi:D-serine deaminase-like pyridoxal phosphate-dependent protein